MGVGQERGLKEKPLSFSDRTSGDFSDMLVGDGAGDIPENTFPMGSGDQGTEFVFLVLCFVVSEAGHGLAEFRNQFVMDFGAGIDPAGGGTVLTRIVEPELTDGGDYFLEVGIVKYDDRGFAPQFQVGSLDVRCCARQDMGAGGDASGQ